MQTILLDLGTEHKPAVMPEEVFTFRPFIKYITQLRDKSSRYKQEFLTSVLEKFAQYPELSHGIEPEKIADYEELLDLVYTTLLPAAEDEHQHYHALALPVEPLVFYSSDDFYKLVLATTAEKKKDKTKPAKDFDRLRNEFCYTIILKKYYDYGCPFNADMKYVLQDHQTGLLKAFKIIFDTRFIEVHTRSGVKPELDIAKLDAAINDKDALEAFLQTNMPLSLFHFEGFRMMSIENVTETHAIEEIKNQLLLRTESNDEVFSQQIEASLKMLVGANDIELGILPIFKVNDRFTSNDPTCTAGVEKYGADHSEALAEKMNSFLTDVYVKKPKRIFFKEITEADAAKHFYLKILMDNGIKSYALMPVFSNDTLSGILEIYTHREDYLNQAILSKLEPAMPLLSQLLQRNIEGFNNRIETIIKENFTSIQPSVQWKFNEAAWHYLRDQSQKDVPAEIENIDFEKVYPLYGSVDIRNSTVERNDAMLKDLKVQFELLMSVLIDIKSNSGFSLVDAKIFAARKWQELINQAAGFYQQTELNDFLENDLHPFLNHFSKGNPEFAPPIRHYFDALNGDTGLATEHMRLLEVSMNSVISTINNQVEEMSVQAQQAFPCFFEKFRTDGVEYDIYLGQSITPGKTFSDIYLKNMRLLQLRSMALIARQTHALLPELPMPVETTQLIFIHSQPIDIKFRKDERRFDVEGAYNIRYQVVKKRIDKVHIKDTDERLTAPDKIAITYFNQKEADEYLGYIHYLQQEQLLTEEIEFLELEPLQGVVGMKALRVGVNVH